MQEPNNTRPSLVQLQKAGSKLTGKQFFEGLIALSSTAVRSGHELMRKRSSCSDIGSDQHSLEGENNISSNASSIGIDGSANNRGGGNEGEHKMRLASDRDLHEASDRSFDETPNISKSTGNPLSNNSRVHCRNFELESEVTQRFNNMRTGQSIRRLRVLEHEPPESVQIQEAADIFDDGYAKKISDRRLSRRFRNSGSSSLEKGGGAKNAKTGGLQRLGPSNLGYMKLREANLVQSLTRQPSVITESSIACALMRGLDKGHLCDVTLVGNDGVKIPAPSFLLAAHSSVFEDLLFLKGRENGNCGGESTTLPPTDISQQDWEDSDDDTFLSAAAYNNPADGKGGKTLHVDICPGFVLRAVVYYMASRSLNGPNASNDFEVDETESNIRAVSQLFLLGRAFKLKGLQDHAYSTARRLINKKGVLACAVFDEFVKADAKAGVERANSLDSAMSIIASATVVPVAGDNLKKYALQILRDHPTEVLLGGGVIMLTSPRSIKVIVKAQDIEVDEYTMFRILNAWVKGAPGGMKDKIKVGKELVSNIDLTFIDPPCLNGIVKRCGFVDENIVKDALKMIEWLLENQDPKEKEHVVVDSAGDEIVNGIYVRLEGEIGVESDEVIFVKEAKGDGDDLGLYCWGNTWNIGPCNNYSDVIYSCTVNEDSKVTKSFGRHKEIVPKWGWTSGRGSGRDPAPVCSWQASREEVKLSDSKAGLAPTLDEIMDPKSQKDGSDYADRRNLTLDDMMNLPIDEDFDDDTKYDSYPSQAKTFEDMCELPQDDGFTESVLGYDASGSDLNCDLSQIDIEENNTEKPKEMHSNFKPRSRSTSS